MPDTFRELVRETERLVRQVQAWSPSAWKAPGPGGRSRAEWAVSLSGELVALGRRAGTGVPVGVVPPRLADYALADQVTVLAEDLIAALGDPAVRPEDWESLACEAHAVVRAARADLEPLHTFGFRPRQ